MNKPVRIIAAMTLVAAGVSCKNKPSEEEAPPPKPRWQYTAEDFGIGRPHTKSAACNRQIDQLLEQIRACYNTREQRECEGLQQKNSDRIGRLKNSRRCSR
jgi:hypothetical protein